MEDIRNQATECASQFLKILNGSIKKSDKSLPSDVLKNTPNRVGRMVTEILSGYYEDPNDHIKIFGDETEDREKAGMFTSEMDEMVISKGIDFFSLCEHHMLPFYGHIHIGYVPNGRVLGVSKLARIGLVFAKRLQLQERLTQQIADFLFETDKRKDLGKNPDMKMNFKGVGVIVEAVHLCEVMRGIKQAHTVMVTSAMRGGFKDNGETRSEFISLIKHRDNL